MPCCGLARPRPWPRITPSAAGLAAGFLAVVRAATAADVVINSTAGALLSPAPSIFEVRVPTGGLQRSLYDPAGHIVVLNGNALYTELQERSHEPWLVEYYDVSCPQCWYFAPSYQQLADAYAAGDEFAQQLRFGALNCAEQENQRACMEAGALEFPTLMGYNLGASARGAALDSPTLVPRWTSKDGGSGGGGSAPEQPAGAPAGWGDAWSARSLAAWLAANSAYPLSPVQWPPPRGAYMSECCDDGRCRGGGGCAVAAVSGPPGKPAWLRESASGVARFQDARSGFVLLLTGGYRHARQHGAAVEAVRFLVRAFPEGNFELRRLERQLSARDNVQPVELKQMLTEWWRLAPEPHFNVCRHTEVDRTCPIWQLFHVVAASVAGSAAARSPLPTQTAVADEDFQPGTATAQQAMAFVLKAVDEFMTCAECRLHFLQAHADCRYGACEVLKQATEPERAKALVLWLWRVHGAVSLRVALESEQAADDARDKVMPVLLPVGPWASPDAGGSGDAGFGRRALSGEAPTSPRSQPDKRWPPYRDCPGCWRREVVLGLAASAAEANAGRAPPRADEGRGSSASGAGGGDLDPAAAFDEDRVFGYLLQTYLGTEVAGELVDAIGRAADVDVEAARGQRLWFGGSGGGRGGLQGRVSAAAALAALAGLAAVGFLRHGALKDEAHMYTRCSS